MVTTLEDFWKAVGLPPKNPSYGKTLKNVAMTASVAILMSHIGVFIYHLYPLLALLAGALVSFMCFRSTRTHDRKMRVSALMIGALLTGASVASMAESFSIVERDLLLGLFTGAFSPVIFILLAGYILTVDHLYSFMLVIFLSGVALYLWSMGYALYTGVTLYHVCFLLFLGSLIFALALWHNMKNIMRLSANGETEVDFVKHGALTFLGFVAFLIVMLLICGA